MSHAGCPSYQRSLRPWDAALIVVGGIISGGIFLNHDIAAQRTGSGRALLLVWAWLRCSGTAATTTG